VKAAQNGDIGLVRTAMQQHIDVNCTNKDGWTALHWAACKKHVDIVSLLIGGGAVVDQRTTDTAGFGNTALLVATLWNGGIAVVTGLLAAKANITTIDTHPSFGFTVLHQLACRDDRYWPGSERTAMATLLLNNGAHTCLNIKDKDGGRTPLQFAVERQRDALALFKQATTKATPTPPSSFTRTISSATSPSSSSSSLSCSCIWLIADSTGLPDVISDLIWQYN